MTDYAALFHAYGPATDTPGHLAALAGDDPAARDAALQHLWSAVIHQGTPWTATPPAAREVAALVDAPRLAGTELRANLLTFLAAVAEAARSTSDAELAAMAAPEGVDVDAAVAEALRTGDDEDLWTDAVGEAMYARAVLGCRDAVPTLLAASVAALEDPEPVVRAAAAHAVTACGADVGERLDALAATAGPDERAALVLSMGESGMAPRAYLADPHPGVRACAALAPALADDPAATAEILAALRDPAATDEWFGTRLPQLRTRIRFSLVAAAIERVDDPRRLLPAALALVPLASPYTVDRDWGLLLAALPDGGAARRRYLGALVERAELWDPRNGNAFLAFKKAGLPYDREACRTLSA